MAAARVVAGPSRWLAVAMGVALWLAATTLCSATQLTAQVTWLGAAGEAEAAAAATSFLRGGSKSNHTNNWAVLVR